MPSPKRKRDKVTGKYIPRAKAADHGQRGVKLKGCIPTYVVVHKVGSSFMDWEDVEAFTDIKGADDYVEQDTTYRRLEVQRRLYMNINGRYHRVSAHPLRIPIRGLEETKEDHGTNTSGAGAEAEQGNVQGDGGGASPGEDGRQSGEATTCKLPALLRSPVVPGPSNGNIQDSVNGSRNEVLRDSGKRRTRRRTDVAGGAQP